MTAPEARGVRILLVEKEDMIRALLGKTLRAAGYEVAGFTRPREARKGGRRMRSFVRYLVDFGNETGPERARVDVAKALEFAIDTALNEMARRAKLERRIRAVPVVMANERQLSHVFLSVLINAAHA